MTVRLRRIAGAPLVHFVVLGGALVALAPREPARPAPVVVTRAEAAAYRAAWAAQHGTAPSAADAARLDAELLDDAVLYRAAVDAGLDRRDPTVRRRLAGLATFVGEDAADEASLARTAATLGLRRGDLVVRRHLVQLARLAAEAVGPADVPTDAELAAHLARRAERFAAPPRITFTHVYFARARRGAATDADAAARLRRDPIPATDAALLGDAFIRGATVTGSRAEIARTFGAGFAAAAWDAAPGTWVGPLASAFGLHVVWIADRTPGATPPLAAVRGRVLHEVLRERAAARRAERLRALRDLYAARIEG